MMRKNKFRIRSVFVEDLRYKIVCKNGICRISSFILCKLLVIFCFLFCLVLSFVSVLFNCVFNCKNKGIL